MGIFSFLKKDKAVSVPSWASLLNAKQFEAFISAIDSYFQKKNIPYEPMDGYLKVSGEPFGLEELGLANMVQFCATLPTKDYENAISNHFEGLIRAQEFNKTFRENVKDFDKVKTFIGVRMYPMEHIEFLGREHAVGKPFSDDLFAMLVFDQPESITNVKTEHTAYWNKSDDELFEFGLENIRQSCPVEIAEQEFGNSTIWLAVANHFFTANIVYDLDKHPQLIGRKGSLIALPHRHMALIYPINDMSIVTDLNNLLGLTQDMYKEGPGSLSRNLYWYADNSFEKLDVHFSDENTIQFKPTEKFLAMLETIQKPGEDEKPA